jgi:hypothetical protein
MSGGKVKSGSTDEKTYVISGDPIKAGSKTTVAFEARFDNNPGANLIRFAKNKKNCLTNSLYKTF